MSGSVAQQCEQTLSREIGRSHPPGMIKMAYVVPPNTNRGLCLSGMGLSERRSGPVGKLTFKIMERGKGRVPQSIAREPRPSCAFSILNTQGPPRLLA